MNSTCKSVADWFYHWLQQADGDRFLLSERVIKNGANCLTDDSEQGFLSVGLPDEKFCSGKTTDYVFWFPQGLPAGSSVHVASSRIGNRPDSKPGFFDAIRTLASRFDPVQYFLTTHKGISTHDYVAGAARLFDLPIVEFRRMPDSVDSAWFQNVLNSATESVCYYSCTSGKRNIQIDDLMISSAKEVRLLSVRNKGNVYSATTNRLATNSNETCESKKTFLLVDRELTNAKTSGMLQAAGVVPWWLYKSDSDSLDQPAPMAKIIRLAEYQEQNSLSDFLIHWTRSRKGPWPNQSRYEFVDDLVLGFPSSDHSRLATICRIVATKMLLANNQITRASTPVVCFSELPVDKLADARTFRSHLSRWDCESVGIAIHRTALILHGAQPVTYGDDDLWKKLSDIEKPFFQIESTCTSTGQIDWTNEKEWRIVGNLDLARVKPTDAFVFVETADEAASVAQFSCWPVVILSEN